MKNIKKILAVGLVSMFVLSTAGCNMIAKTPEAIKNAPVAKVNGESIAKKDLDSRMTYTVSQLVTQYGSDWENNADAKKSYDSQRDQTLDEMISEKVIIQKAKAGNGYPSDKDINDETDKEFTATKTQNSTTFASALKSAGYTEDTYKQFLKEQVIVNKCIQFLVKDVKVSDSDVQKEYDTNKKLKYTTNNSKMNLEHILVATEAEAKKVVERIKNGEKFETVAKEVSTDTGTKTNGGALGDYYYNDSLNQQQLDPTFVKAAMAVPAGQISAPVQTSYGWHVIKCVSRTEYPVKSFDAVKDQIKQTLLQTAQNNAITDRVTQWKKDLGSKIKKYPKNY